MDVFKGFILNIVSAVVQVTVDFLSGLLTALLLRGGQYLVDLLFPRHQFG